MRKERLRATALACGMLFVANAGSAATIITANELGAVRGGSATGVVPNAVTASGTGGLFEFRQTSALSPDLLPIGENFVAFCLEFNEYLDSSNRAYNLVALEDAPMTANEAVGMGMGGDKADLIAAVIKSEFGLAIPDYDNIDNDDALAVQIAIWEIVHETGAIFDPTDITSDAYWTAPAAVVTAAKDLITAALLIVEDGLAEKMGLAALVAWNTGCTETPDGCAEKDKQDFLVWEKNPSQEVPLPAAAWLLLSGLAGLGVVSRRRKTA